MAVRHVGEVEAQARQHALHGAAELEGVLQCARAMKGQAQVAVGAQLLQRLGQQHFDQVLAQGAHPCGFGRVSRVVLEQVRVILDEGAAAAGGLHDRFGAIFDGRPPGVDIATCPFQAGLLGIEVIIHGAAAAGLADRGNADTQPVQDPRSRRVGVGRQARLYATFEHQHATGMLAGRAWFGRGDALWQLQLQALG
ncbi:hypothetical protein D9M71_463530 [compost metagenome]